LGGDLHGHLFGADRVGVQVAGEAPLLGRRFDDRNELLGGRWGVGLEVAADRSGGERAEKPVGVAELDPGATEAGAVEHEMDKAGIGAPR
jgi:hypothetical protein